MGALGQCPPKRTSCTDAGPAHAQAGPHPLPRLPPHSRGRDPPTGKAVGWGGGLGRKWGELRPGGQRRCAPGPGAATGEVAQPEAPGQGRGSEPGSATGRGAGVRRCLRFLPTGRAGAAFRAGHCGTECGARFPGSPRYCRPAAPGPWHRAPSVSNRKSLTTGRSIDPSIPPASGRQECPDPPSLSPERLRGNRPGPCPLAAPAHLRARALSSGPRTPLRTRACPQLRPEVRCWRGRRQTT